MESAKKAVDKFLHKDGKHETDVQQRIAPAVQHEEIQTQQREEIITAVDREIHQDHYRTVVQPITDTQVLPEQHHYRTAPTEYREFQHGNADDVQGKLRTEASKFQNETTRTEGVATSETAAINGTTHVHNHIHESVQPVLERKVIERHFIHTAVPVPQAHQKHAEHDHTSTVVSVDDPQRHGGASTGPDQRAAYQQGAPQPSESIPVGGGASQLTQPVQTRANTGSMHSTNTGVAGNAAISAARAAAMGQRPS